MREINRFQRTVSQAAKQIRDGYPNGNDEEVKIVFDRFSQSRQEPFKIAAALYCFFSSGKMKESERRELERFIRMRIRNVVEALIEEDAPEKIEILQGREWFGLIELDSFINIARERRKTQALIYLMTVKNNRYGYREQEWML